MRLFCLPYGGAGSAAYFPWAKLLPAEIELCAIRLPGRETRIKEAPYTSLRALAYDLAKEITPYLDRPFAIFGHSLGALIGFELLNRFRDQGSPSPVRLFVSGRRAAHLPDPNPPVYLLPDQALIAEIQTRYNGIPRVILEDEDLMSLFLPTLRADFTLVETYSYSGAKITIPLTAFGGEEDPLVAEADLAAWGDLCCDQFALQMFPGDHFFIHSQSEAVIRAIVCALESDGLISSNSTKEV